MQLRRTTANVGLTAVIVSHNSEAELSGCLEALRVDPSVSTVVVDNASDDGSPEVARSMADSRITVLSLETNTGFAGGCNRGFEAQSSSCEWIAFMNPDVVVQPDCLSRCVEILAARPEVACVAPRLMRPDGVTVDSVGQVLRPLTLEVQDRGYGQPLGRDLLEERQVLAACGALGVYRREALDSVTDERGPWPEHYFCFWEDLELGWRLTNRGWRVEAVPDAVAIHGRGAGAGRGRGPLRWRRPPHLEACVLSNRWMTLIRHLHTLDAIRHLPILLIWDLGLLTLSVAHRPRLLPQLRLRWRLVYREWRRRELFPRKRLTELPC
jgi:GT2 family glycosyltransferase